MLKYQPCSAMVPAPTRSRIQGKRGNAGALYAGEKKSWIPEFADAGTE